MSPPGKLQSFFRVAVYQQNLPRWERLVRVTLGFGWVAVAFVAPMPPAGSWLLAASGVFVGLTAGFGFCPACYFLSLRPSFPRKAA